jgi:hypothetical protein
LFLTPLIICRNSSLSDSSGRNTPTASGHSSSAKQSCSSVVTEMTDDQDLEHISQALEPNGSIHLCFFSFNGCTFASQNVMQWKSHCTEHFKEQELLPSMDCFLCEFRADTTEEGTAWAQILHHTAVEHKNGQRTMPTEGLLRFLLQLGIIEKSLSKKGTDPDSSSLNPNSSSSRPDRSLDFRAINIFGQSIHK